jgi:hypothetical protein
MSYTMSFMFNILDQVPQTKTQYYCYLIGSSLSCLMIICISDKFYGRRKKFLPLLIWSSVQLVSHLTSFIIQLCIPLKDNIYSSVINGFIDSTLNFYYLFVCPIMIAYAHRASQFITPIATILTLNLVVSNVVNYMLTDTMVSIILSLTDNQTALRVPPILCLVVCLSIVYP